MISFYQLITITYIITAVALIYFFIQLDKIRSNYTSYVFSLLVIIIIAGLIELSISIKFWTFATITYPVYLTILYLIYPIFFLYAKRLVFTRKELSNEKSYLHYIIPLAALIATSVFYYPLSNESQIDFIAWNPTNETENSSTDSFLFLLIVVYYAQFFFYLANFVILLKSSKNNMSDRIIDKNIALQWLRVFILTFFLFESIVFLFFFFFPKDVYEIVAQTSSLVIIVFLGLFRINQSTIEIQTRLRKAKVMINDVGHESPKYIIDEDEKKEILKLITDVLTEKKFFIDPNLKVEQFAKKIHVSPKKLSIVINELTGNNFSNFLNEYRIQEAKLLLETVKDNSSIEEIFLKTGFNSRSTFNRVFKQATGLTPNEYKLKLNK